MSGKRRAAADARSGYRPAGPRPPQSPSANKATCSTPTSSPSCARLTPTATSSPGTTPSKRGRLAQRADHRRIRIASSGCAAGHHASCPAGAMARRPARGYRDHITGVDASTASGKGAPCCTAAQRRVLAQAAARAPPRARARRRAERGRLIGGVTYQLLSPLLALRQGGRLRRHRAGRPHSAVPALCVTVTQTFSATAR